MAWIETVISDASLSKIFKKYRSIEAHRGLGKGLDIRACFRYQILTIFSRRARTLLRFLSLRLKSCRMRR